MGSSITPLSGQALAIGIEGMAVEMPGRRPSTFSTRAAQLLQVMPAMSIDSARRGSAIVEELMMQLLLR